jgi:biopolymer transport protein TolQ
MSAASSKAAMRAGRTNGQDMDQQTIALASDIDFSLWALFARATFTVQVVMIILILASFWSWAIIIQKHIVFRRAKGESEVFDAAFWSG